MCFLHTDVKDVVDGEADIWLLVHLALGDEHSLRVIGYATDLAHLLEHESTDTPPRSCVSAVDNPAAPILIMMASARNSLVWAVSTSVVSIVIPGEGGRSSFAFAVLRDSCTLVRGLVLAY